MGDLLCLGTEGMDGPIAPTAHHTPLPAAKPRRFAVYLQKRYTIILENPIKGEQSRENQILMTAVRQKVITKDTITTKVIAMSAKDRCLLPSLLLSATAALVASLGT